MLALNFSSQVEHIPALHKAVHIGLNMQAVLRHGLVLSFPKGGHCSGILNTTRGVLVMAGQGFKDSGESIRRFNCSSPLLGTILKGGHNIG